MKSLWLKSTIGELCVEGNGKVQTGPFGSQLHQSDYSEDGTPVVMPTDIPSGRIDVSRIARVSDSHIHRLARHQLEKGDIVYGRRGDIGRQALVRDENVGWLCGTGCLRIRLGNSQVDSEYLHRYLTMPEIIGWIEEQAIGATMPNLNTDILSRVPIYFPKRKTQRKIAAILTAYDDLIETNKCRIALLEKMAEELYREWFVRMRFPGHQNTRFVKGVPEGWEVKPISSFCEEVRNSVKKKDLADDEIYIGLEHIPRKSIAFKEWAVADSVDSNKLRFNERDILFSKIRPYLHITVFSDTFIELATIAAKGTKMPRADWAFLEKLEFKIPLGGCPRTTRG
jgi:type I restriction enzyme S subunit